MRRVAETTAPVRIEFESGTLALRGLPEALQAGVPECRFDPRSACLRAPAHRYAELVRALRRAGHPIDDRARAYRELDRPARLTREARPYQREAVQAWRAAGGRGVVVLPTGAGKTEVAMIAIADRRRATLVVAPTLDLVRQWVDRLELTFGPPIGIVGGGEHTVENLTVTTYDSAYLHMEHLGGRFGMLVFDECHHLPGESYAQAARMALAPYRLGLTATPERSDGREAALDDLVGGIVYRKDIRDLAGAFLSAYQTARIVVELSAEERAEYAAARSIYVSFLAHHRISMAAPDGWSRFIMLAARSEAGRRALAAYRRQRELALCAPAKLDCLETLLARHRDAPVLVFTQDNALCHRVATRFLIPPITHHTRVRERVAILRGFAKGRLGAIVTSKVLNEGVDLPAASVAVVLSGSASVREHVQRLGRILRPQPGKEALLYELVTGGTSETFASERRRAHSAYRPPPC